MSHRTFIESSAVTLRRLFDWTNMAAALHQFFGAARHPCFEVSVQHPITPRYPGILDTLLFFGRDINQCYYLEQTLQIITLNHLIHFETRGKTKYNRSYC